MQREHEGVNENDPQFMERFYQTRNATHRRRTRHKRGGTAFQERRADGNYNMDEYNTCFVVSFDSPHPLHFGLFCFGLSTRERERWGDGWCSVSLILESWSAPAVSPLSPSLSASYGRTLLRALC